MIWNGKNGKNKCLVDETGKRVPFVKSYNDKTGEAEIYLKGSNGFIIDNGSLAIAKIKLENCKLMDV